LIELHCASAFSFLEAASLPETLVDRAAALGYPALALLDRDGVYGAPRFHKAARAAGIKPIIGCELTIETTTPGVEREWFDDSPASSRQPPAASRQSSVWRLPVLIQSREGYRNLSRLLTLMKLRSPKGEGALNLGELEGRTTGLIAIAGREVLSASRHGVGGLLDRLVGMFGRANVCLEMQRHFLRDEETDNEVLRDLAAAFHVPLIVSNGVRFADPIERPLFDVLTCIHHKTTLDRAGRRLARNAERYLKPPAEMAGLFRDCPEAVAATAALSDRIEYSMADLGYRFPDYPVPEGETSSSFLRAITLVGARERYRPFHDRARTQIARELDLIEKLNLAGYFLIVWDIVNFCRQQQILVQGRGSAANSAVCYSLGITAVDPVGMDLLFERFLSEERGEWPDIDLDLPSGDRRERVIQHVYEKYGRHGAAMTANLITYRGRSAAREVGKTLGMEAAQIDRLSKILGHFEFVDQDESLSRDLRASGFDPGHAEVRLFADLWRRIQDLPRHLGQHSGGMVLCQGRLDDVVPLENASMPGRVVVQWDKEDCADMGLIKIDLLGLGMMAALQDAFETINRRRAPGTLPVELWTLPPDDPTVYDMFQRADTVGVFQIESRAQMATLPRLKPAHFYDLVVEVALIRPGPIVGQMVHPYLNRRAGREQVLYPHPSLEPILARTMGVPLFQEQLLRIAMVAAGFTGGQAEELRRAMGFKRSEQRMKKIEVQLREGMARKGITGDAADGIVKSISSFALYGFPESHAASFALLVYASGYLKAHFPGAFYTALLNNQPMGFYHPASLVKDAQRHGVRFASIDVLHSDWDCQVEADGTIRLGLRYVNGLRQSVGLAIELGARGSGIGASQAGARGSALGASTDDVAYTSAGFGQQASGFRREGKDERTPSPQLLAPGVGCPKCGCDDPSMLERVETGREVTWFCNICAHDWKQVRQAQRFRSIEDLIHRTGINREELAVLAEIGALNAFGHHRREALWQIERAVRPAGELFEEDGARDQGRGDGDGPEAREEAQPASGSSPRAGIPSSDACPLLPMSLSERLVADYAGTNLTIGPHPMALRRQELALRGVLRSGDLPRERQGRRVRVAGTVITRQRPGTAKGFVFLTLEDETGISNIIVRPDLFARQRLTILEEAFLLVEGVLQNQEGVVSVRAERLEGIPGVPIEIDSHDFY
jgi:error-prone DNA polymerase